MDDLLMVGQKIAGLNLGSRNRAIPGFLNIDCDQHEGVDIVGDISDLSRFEGGSVSEIYASHCLEHFPHPRTLSVLKEWYRVLEPGGKLYVGVPDFARCVELYAITGITQWLQDYVSGGHEYATAKHEAIFDHDKLSRLLREAGFSESFRVECFPIGDESDCSNLKSTHDGLPVSLNLIAVKA
jgi:predicted SAM-dependent methyltransferase